MELKIFHSILFGELRPWLNENRDDKKFSQGLIPEITNPQTPAGFKNALAKIIPAHLLEDETLKIYRQPENIQEPFIKAPIALIDAPQPNNPATRFYAHLISNEATFVISELHQVLTGDGMDELQSEYLIKELKKATVSLLKEIPKTLATQPEDDHQSRLVITILKHNMIRLLIEPELLYPHFTEVPAVHVDQIFNEYLREPAPEAPFYTVSSELFRVQTQLFFRQSPFDRNHGIDLMKQIVSQIETDQESVRKIELYSILYSLESFIFMQGNRLSDEEFNPEDSHTLKTAYEQSIENLRLQIERLPMGYQRLEVVNKALDDLDYLHFNDAPKNNGWKKSLPRRIKHWLLEQKEIYKYNISEKFPVTSIPELKEQEKLEDEIDSKFSFCFKGDIEKLRVVIQALCNKIDFLNEDKTSVAECVKALTSRNLKIGFTQIHIECETVQFAYIIYQLKPHFSNLTPKSIENSKLFFSKNNSLISAQNLYSNNRDNPKNKENIDRILKTLQ